jgi:hypothetical protein
VALSESERIVVGGGGGGVTPVTVMLAVPELLPVEAVITAAPAATPVTVKRAEAAPAGTLTEPGTVATAVLPLDRVTVAPVVAESVTVPCAVVPAAMLAGVIVTLDTVSVDGGVTLLLLPHWTRSIENAATVNATTRDRVLFNMGDSVWIISG